jgi:hypothetical protein
LASEISEKIKNFFTVWLSKFPHIALYYQRYQTANRKTEKFPQNIGFCSVFVRVFALTLPIEAITI